MSQSVYGLRNQGSIFGSLEKTFAAEAENTRAIHRAIHGGEDVPYEFQKYPLMLTKEDGTNVFVENEDQEKSQRSQGFLTVQELAKKTKK
jgi:hypothetical protein